MRGVPAKTPEIVRTETATKPREMSEAIRKTKRIQTSSAEPLRIENEKLVDRMRTLYSQRQSS